MPFFPKIPPEPPPDGHQSSVMETTHSEPLFPKTSSGNKNQQSTKENNETNETKENNEIDNNNNNDPEYTHLPPPAPYDRAAARAAYKLIDDTIKESKQVFSTLL